ncbi:hypothetical protein A2U01_0089678, partial [Trifolium medium]|nr:hypothetical protein [Trifolium medium]
MRYEGAVAGVELTNQLRWLIRFLRIWGLRRLQSIRTGNIGWSCMGMR